MDKSEVLEVNTTAGTLRAYKSPDPGQPGIVIMLQPKGFEEEIDLSFVSVYQDPDYQTASKERKEDVVVMTYTDPYTEDYSQKDILRREDIEKALGGAE